MTSRPTLASAVLAIALFTACPGGGGTVPVKGDCYLDSDCQAGLVCLFKRCHVECQSDDDCDNDVHCRELRPPITACLLDDEIACTPGVASCPGVTYCAADLTCRNLCQTSADCIADQTCAGGVCANPSELVDGGVPQLTDEGASSCQFNSDCPVLLRCRDQVCRKDCRVEGDCNLGERCTADRLCARPGESAAPVPDGGTGVAGYGEACRSTSDCESALQCLTSRCGVPCFGATDCGHGECCVANQCVNAAQCPAVTQGERCTGTQDCATGWCDDGVCTPQCVMNGCTNGRECDLSTRTCVTPCQGLTCGAGEACAAGVCRRVCDLAFPCGSGFKCSAGACVPECATQADCAAHRTCQSGACVFDGTCTSDFDCPTSALCVRTGATGSCQARSGALDGGGFACAGPCSCRSGEVCVGQACAADVVPNRFVSSSGTGDGLAAERPAADPTAFFTADAGPVVVALLMNEAFFADGGIALAAPGQGLVGGYRVCGDNRWVRDLGAHSQLSAGTFEVVRALGTVSRPLTGTTVRGLELNSGTVCSGTEVASIGASFASGLSVSQVSGRWAAAPACAGAEFGVVRVSDSSAVSLDDVTLGASALIGNGLPVLAVNLKRSAGTVRRVTIPAQAVNGLSAVAVANASGPVDIRQLEVAQVVSTGYLKARLVWLRDNVTPMTVRESHLVFPTANSAPTQLACIVAERCESVSLSDLHLDGAGFSGVMPTGTSVGDELVGVQFIDTSGSVVRTRIDLPVTGAVGTSWNGEMTGIAVQGPRSNVELGDDLVNAPQAVGSFRGYRVRDIARSGVVSLHGLVLDGGTAAGSGTVAGIDIASVPGFAGLTLRDVDLNVPAGRASCSVLVGVRFTSSTGLVERARVRVRNSGAMIALATSESRLELYSSHLAIETGTCPGNAVLDVTASSGASAAALWAVGNTFESTNDLMSTGVSAAFSCSGPSSVVASSNIFTAGAGRNAQMIRSATVPQCLAGASFDHNYFWYGYPGPRATSENVGSVTASDGGLPDALGNIVGENVNPFGLAPPLTYVLPAGSVCVDRGAAGTRRDGTAVDRDVDGRPRVNGSAADIGAYER